MATMLHSKKLLTLGGFWSFFAFGYIDNLKGPLLPEMLRDDSLSYTQAGNVIFAAYLGFIMATVTIGFVAEMLGNRLVLFFAAICLCIGLLGVQLFPEYHILLWCMWISGLGLGAIELGANGLIVQLHADARGRFLNLLATFHGCGSLLVPLVAATLIERGWPWQSIYAAALILALPMLVVFWPAGQADDSMGKNDQPAAQASIKKFDARQFAQAAFSPIMIVFYVTIAAYVAIELSVAAWMMEFLQKQEQMTVVASSYYQVAFFVLLMLGRLLGSFVVERTNYLAAIATALVGSGICLVIGLFGGSGARWLLPISGFFMSIVFPTLTAAVTRLHPSGSSSILGVLFACGGIGGALGPWTVGRISDAYGLTIGLASTLAFVALSLGGVVVLSLIARKDSSA